MLIEDAGPGQQLLQDLQRDRPPGMIRPIGRKPDASKADRMAAQSAKIEAGHVFLLKDAPWLPDFLNEVLAFPFGRHDDQVDALSQFLGWAAVSRFQPTVAMFGPMIFYGDD
ncbi:MAG: phage terminase large subunit [Albidovulum sp.]|nr:MAG: phage terminase large subunit [Defluviimonas sp.]